MGRQPRWFLWCLLLVPVVLLLTLSLQQYLSSAPDIKEELLRALDQNKKKGKPRGPCPQRSCPQDQFSFLLQSGAANVVSPKICFQDKLVLGQVLNNAGVGINVVIVNGRTGDMLRTDFFNMYSGDVKPLVALLQGVEAGSVVLMASYDDPSTKLSNDARQLISALGSVSVKSLAFRDCWVFVGGKGASTNRTMEKHSKNNKATNKYVQWPEMVELQGCIPKYLG
ncbi:protein FAM3C-like isoform X2 [Pseudochaenichthys georgianus]|uniref:protein FAM3C-like isoform X2 n=1 Tax=Pseudochaenichthys georgianus TaxID=52239 RepID=UPI00146D4B4E|nr:protein FAM3C-like isoform X2 [Pseudochaenichthys georgianus]